MLFELLDAGAGATKDFGFPAGPLEALPADGRFHARRNRGLPTALHHGHHLPSPRSETRLVSQRLEKVLSSSLNGHRLGANMTAELVLRNRCPWPT